MNSTTVDAVHWYKILTAELKANVNWGTPGMGGDKAKQRVRALIDLFFAVSGEMGTKEIIEIGAHDAEASRRFIKDDPEAFALAYEASPSVYKRVVGQGPIERFRMLHGAIGAKAGEVAFFEPNDPFYAVWGSTARRAGFSDVTEVKVPMITLDQAAESLNLKTYARDVAMWIDVEGRALDVIQGGTIVLKTRIATMYVELNDINAYEDSASAVRFIALMLECGFVPLARDNEYPDAWNIIFVHKSYFEKANEAFTRWAYADLDQP